MQDLPFTILAKLLKTASAALDAVTSASVKDERHRTLAKGASLAAAVIELTVALSILPKGIQLSLYQVSLWLIVLLIVVLWQIAARNWKALAWLVTFSAAIPLLPLIGSVSDLRFKPRLEVRVFRESLDSATGSPIHNPIGGRGVAISFGDAGSPITTNTNQDGAATVTEAKPWDRLSIKLDHLLSLGIDRSSGVIELGLAGPRHLRFGTGQSLGFYNKFGKAFASLVASHDSEIALDVITTQGSDDNFQQIMDGKLDIGLAQRDVFYDLIEKTDSPFPQGKRDELKIIWALFLEPLHVLTPVRIDSIEGLKRGRINIDPKLSGSHHTTDKLFKATNVSPTLKTEHDFTSGIELLKHGGLDAMMFWRAVPAPGVLEVIGPSFHLIPLDPNTRLQGLNAISGSREITIPAPAYGMERDIQTIGVRAILVGNASIEPNVIERLVEILDAHRGELSETLPDPTHAIDFDQTAAELTGHLHAGTLSYLQLKRPLSK